MRRMVAALGIVAATCSMAFAQNARVSAMGGCSVTPDFTDVLSEPAYVNDHPDKIQGTGAGGAGAATYGPVMGVKSFGPSLNLGFYSVPYGVLMSDKLDGVGTGKNFSVGIRHRF